MSLVNVINVICNTAKAPFTSTVSFDVFFEVQSQLKHSKSFPLTFADLTWRIIYIGHASDIQYDQVLEDADMEELEAGQMKFTFEVLSVVNCLGQSSQHRQHPQD